MSEKDTNEILEEQRRARQEFLELKKMQSGEMAGPAKAQRGCYCSQNAQGKMG